MRCDRLVSPSVGVIFEEQASGTKRDGRTELQKVLDAQKTEND